MRANSSHLYVLFNIRQPEGRRQRERGSDEDSDEDDDEYDDEDELDEEAEMEQWDSHLFVISLQSVFSGGEIVCHKVGDPVNRWVTLVTVVTLVMFSLGVDHLIIWRRAAVFCFRTLLFFTMQGNFFHFLIITIYKP